MDKRGGMQRLLSWIIYIIFVIVLFVVLLFFIKNSASGELVKRQILAKQVALFIDAARPGTTMTILKGDFDVTVSDNFVNVKSKNDINGYSYNFFSPYSVNLETTGNVLKISINKK